MNFRQTSQAYTFFISKVKEHFAFRFRIPKNLFRLLKKSQDAAIDIV